MRPCANSANAKIIANLIGLKSAGASQANDNLLSQKFDSPFQHFVEKREREREEGLYIALISNADVATRN
jgi:hypothetical protein